MFKLTLILTLIYAATVFAEPNFKSIQKEVATDYKKYLKSQFEYFHSHPELSFLEFNTAKRMAEELKKIGFNVTEGIGKTGVVAMLENGKGPLVMMRADMDALPIHEQTNLPYKSEYKQYDPSTDKEVYVMHACGHDVHITSLLGTARYMIKHKDKWSGTLMLVVQPAEERGGGAKAMREDGIWEKFGTPDYALAFHVASAIPSGYVHVIDGSPYAGVDSVDIIVHGIGGHGAAPHTTIDPIVLASQIVVSLQTLVSRTLAPREPGVVTVGSFHAGSKHNIISNRAKLELTVRNTNNHTRKKLLDGIKRIAINSGKAAGLPDDLLPEVILLNENVPPTVNSTKLAQRLRKVWSQKIGDKWMLNTEPQSMGGEDFPYFTQDPFIESVYFNIGGGDPEVIRKGKMPSHHSPYFEIQPQPSVTRGVEATVVALFELMGN